MIKVTKYINKIHFKPTSKYLQNFFLIRGRFQIEAAPWPIFEDFFQKMLWIIEKSYKIQTKFNLWVFVESFFYYRLLLNRGRSLLAKNKFFD